VGGNPKPEIFVDTYGAALNLAVHGNGVALVSKILAQHAIKAGQLELAHKAAVPCKEGYHLRVNEAKPKAKHFGDWLLGKIEGSNP